MSKRRPFKRKLQRVFKWIRSAICTGTIFHASCRRFYSPGSVGWLVSSEQRYGGVAKRVPVKTSLHMSTDPHIFCRGGDRMLSSGHSYAFAYSEYLQPHLDSGKITLLEIGILKGSGLATWCDLFPTSRIIGLDVDLRNIKNNLDNLKSRGAFQQTSPELYEFDQFQDNRELLSQVLKGDTIDVCIDDGCHYPEPTANTLRCVLPHLSKNFTYIVEDVPGFHSQIAPLLRELLPDCKIRVYDGEMTIITRQGH